MITVTIEKTQPELDDNYPCLKQFRDQSIILFTSRNTGLCVYARASSANKFGERSDTWVEYEASPFTGKLILENKIIGDEQ